MCQEIRLSRADEGPAILEIINDAAEAYRGLLGYLSGTTN